MRTLVALAFAFVAFVALGAGLARPSLGPVPLGLVVMCVVLERDVVGGALTSALVGYVADVLWASERGLHALAAAATFLLLRVLVARVPGSRPPTVIGLGTLGVALVAVLPSLADALLGGGTRSPLAALGAAPGLALAGALCAWPTFVVFRRVERGFREREEDAALRRL